MDCDPRHRMSAAAATAVQAAAEPRWTATIVTCSAAVRTAAAGRHECCSNSSGNNSSGNNSSGDDSSGNNGNNSSCSSTSCSSSSYCYRSSETSMARAPCLPTAAATTAIPLQQCCDAATVLPPPAAAAAAVTTAVAATAAAAAASLCSATAVWLCST
jgi:hypothetical protein